MAVIQLLVFETVTTSWTIHKRMHACKNDDLKLSHHSKWKNDFSKIYSEFTIDIIKITNNFLTLKHFLFKAQKNFYCIYPKVKDYGNQRRNVSKVYFMSYTHCLHFLAPIVLRKEFFDYEITILFLCLKTYYHHHWHLPKLSLIFYQSIKNNAEHDKRK